MDKETKLAFIKVSDLVADALFRIEMVAVSDGSAERMEDILKELDMSRQFIKEFQDSLPA
jgi:hypothetical protein